MPVMDEFREEREMMKNKSKKERLEYFWDYYKWWVIGGIIGIIILASIIHDIINSKKDILQVAMINYYKVNEQDTTFSDDFTARIGLNPKKESVTFLDDLRFLEGQEYSQETYAAKQQVSVYMAARSLDVFLASNTVLRDYAYDRCFADLKTIFSDEEYKALEEKGLLYYVDSALFEERQEKKMNLADETPFNYGDPTDPASMEAPVAVGIQVQDCKKLNSYYLPLNDDKVAAVSIIANCTEDRRERAKEFILYLLEE